MSLVCVCHDVEFWSKGLRQNLGFAHVLVNGSPNGQLVTIWLCLMRIWSELWLWIWGWVCCLIGPTGLHVSPVSLGSCNLNGVGSIGSRPIEHETRHIIQHFLWRNFTQKTNLGYPKIWLNPSNRPTGSENWPNEQYLFKWS